MSECCVSGFMWGGQPVGKEGKLGNNKAYITGSNKDVAILLLHDIYGWTFTNTRLLADHFAKEADATVFLPNFFGDHVYPLEMLLDPVKREKFDFEAFRNNQAKNIRYPEITACARALKEEQKFQTVGAIGYCWGGWGVLKLGARGENLVDCISTAHPSWLTKEEIDSVAVPIQILAPEQDSNFTPELKAHANGAVPGLGVDYDYQFFPGVAHGFAVRGDQSDSTKRKALERAKNAAVGWFAQHLHPL